jgi:hypothetical protein
MSDDPLPALVTNAVAQLRARRDAANEAGFLAWARCRFSLVTFPPPSTKARRGVGVASHWVRLSKR